MWPQWTSMLNAWQWAALALIPPAIIALYFLKLRRQPLEVPSTYLWHKTIEDLHVNSLWQRLRQSLLLFLQLALLLLLMVALLAPSWQGTELTGDRFIFLIDNSASMSALDVEPTRLEEAKRQVETLIEALKPGDVAMVVSFADRARIEQPFTSNRNELRRRLAAIEPTQRPTSLTEALTVASGLANPGRSGTDVTDIQVAEALPATIYIFSDGKFADVTDFSLGNLDAVYVPIGHDDPQNVGIGAFSVAPGEDDRMRLQAFARLENYGTRDATVGVSLYLDGELIDADQVDIEAGERRGVEFNLSGIERGTLELRIDNDDDLPDDNRAWATVEPPRRAQVLAVTPGNEPLLFSLGTENALELAEVRIERPGFLETAEYQRQASTGALDLVIYDRCAPQDMPLANTLFIGRVPPVTAWQSSGPVDVPQVIDTDTAHPLMQFVSMGDVLFREARTLEAPPGHTVLVDSHLGPLLVIAPREAFEDVVLGFELVGEQHIDTNWALRPSFPVFVLNALRYLGGHGQDAAAAGSLRPGQPIALRTETAAAEIRIETPTGREVAVRRGSLNTFDFSGTGELGIYAVRDGTQVARRFAVNLFDSNESDIRPRPEGSIGIGHVEVEASAGPEPVRQEAWKPLVLAALAILLFEWYIYNRRVYL